MEELDACHKRRHLHTLMQHLPSSHERNDWKTDFQFSWNDVFPQPGLRHVWHNLEKTYGPASPTLIRDSVDKGTHTPLVVWYTSKYGEAASTTANANPMFERHVVNGTELSFGFVKDCPVQCVVTDDVRIAPSADVLMFEIGYDIRFPSVRRNPRQIWMGIAWEGSGSSPYNILGHPGAMSMFNLTSHFGTTSGPSPVFVAPEGANN